MPKPWLTYQARDLGIDEDEPETPIVVTARRPTAPDAPPGESQIEAAGRLHDALLAARAEGDPAARIGSVESLLREAGGAASDALRGEAQDWLWSARQPQPESDPQARARPQPVEGQSELARAPGRTIPTQINQRAIEPGRGQGPIAIDRDPEYSLQANPALAGLNRTVNAMLQGRRPIDEVVGAIRDRGVVLDPRAMREVRDVYAWQRRNPGYRGSYTVNLEEDLVRNSPMQRFFGQYAGSGFGAAAGTYFDVITGQHLDNIAGAMGRDSAMFDRSLRQLQRDNPGAAIAGTVAANASLFGLGRRAATRLTGRAATDAGTFSPSALAGDAALGIYTSSGGNGTDLIAPVDDLLTGGAVNMGFGAAGRGVFNAAGRALSPRGGDLAEAYAREVVPSPGQRLGGLLDRAEQAVARMPAAGRAVRTARNDAIAQFRRGAYEDALGEIGARLPPGVANVAAAGRVLDREFTDAFQRARSQLAFRADEGFVDALAPIGPQLSGLQARSRSEYVNFMESRLVRRLRARNGRLDGDDYARFVGRIDARARAIRRDPNGDQELAGAYEATADAFDDAAIRQGGSDATLAWQALRRARVGQRKATVLEIAGSRSRGGVLDPAELEAAVRQAGEGIRGRTYMQGEAPPLEAYAAGGRWLGEPIPDPPFDAPWAGDPVRVRDLPARAIAGLANNRRGRAVLDTLDPISRALFRYNWVPGTIPPDAVARGLGRDEDR